MTKKIILNVLWVMFFTIRGFAQDRMIVDNYGRFPGEEPLHHPITALAQLPDPIVDSIETILKSCLGDFLPKVHFQNGQINDLKLYAASRSKDNFIPLPKYEVFFLLMDQSIGIKRFPVQIGLDENGRVTQITWPRKGFTNPSELLSPSIIKAFAISQARKHHFSRANYRVDLIFDDTKQKLLWEFDFYEGEEDSNYRIIHVITISWLSLSDFEISEAAQVVIN